MVDEETFVVTRQRLKTLGYFLLYFVILMEVWVMYQVTTYPVIWVGTHVRLWPIVLLITSSTVCLGAMICELHHSRTFFKFVVCAGWSVMCLYSGQNALREPQGVTVLPILAHAFISTLVGIGSALAFIHPETKIDPATRRQLLPFIMKQVLLKFMRTSGLAGMVVFFILLRFYLVA